MAVAGAQLSPAGRGDRCHVRNLDSIVVACGGSDVMKPVTAAQYTAALERIGVPVLSLAHVNRADDLRYPFGSVFWHNLSRTTWSLARDGERAIVRHVKHNDHRNLGRFVVEVTWLDDRPMEVSETPYGLVIADRIDEVLVEGSTTKGQIVAALNLQCDEGEPRSATRPSPRRSAGASNGGLIL
jgi:hypothetical protein